MPLNDFEGPFAVLNLSVPIPRETANKLLTQRVARPLCSIRRCKIAIL